VAHNVDLTELLDGAVAADTPADVALAVEEAALQDAHLVYESQLLG
jgi:hypothetical protein